ncbi:MAG: adenylate/guanylate cyclase domain-containing protein [Geminicoccaceae bacterium]
MLAAELDRSPEITAITDWLVEQGLLRSRFETVVEGFCERLVAIGVPLWRGFATVQTLHPTIQGVGNSWRPEGGIRTELFVYRMTPSEEFLQSPFKHMLDEGIFSMRRKLETAERVEFPLIERFRQEGATDYLAQIVGFGVDGVAEGKAGVATSWSTARPGGFSERDLALLAHLVPRLALALEARLGHDTAVNLLNTYVGPEAGRRILDGEIRRGSLQVIEAVIFYADLRGFTSIADGHGRDDMVEMLNDYFDCVVPAVAAEGGQVLKFLGDGLLATFPLADHAAALACERALDAAATALRSVHKLNVERAGAGKSVMELDIVLHLGDVFYGNIGSADRLDFTVIGPAVNEAARIEALCAQHGRNLLVSEAFAEAATGSAGRLVSIGRFALRGVRTSQSIYTLEGV